MEGYQGYVTRPSRLQFRARVRKKARVKRFGKNYIQPQRLTAAVVAFLNGAAAWKLSQSNFAVDGVSYLPPRQA